MLSPRYVDVDLDGVEDIVAQGASWPASTWRVLAQHARQGRGERLAAIMKIF